MLHGGRQHFRFNSGVNDIWYVPRARFTRNEQHKLQVGDPRLWGIDPNGSAPVEQDWGLSVNTSGNFQISVPSTAVGFTLTGAGLGAFAGGITTAFNAGSAAGLRNGLGSVNGFGSNASGGGAETDIYSGAADGITAAFYYNSGATATVSSYITNAGTYVNASDGRLKHDIKDVSYGLDAIMRLNPGVSCGMGATKRTSALSLKKCVQLFRKSSHRWIKKGSSESTTPV